jgi:hypothetical protein
MLRATADAPAGMVRLAPSGPTTWAPTTGSSIRWFGWNRRVGGLGVPPPGTDPTTSLTQPQRELGLTGGRQMNTVGRDPSRALDSCGGARGIPVDDEQVRPAPSRLQQRRVGRAVVRRSVRVLADFGHVDPRNPLGAASVQGVHHGVDVGGHVRRRVVAELDDRKVEVHRHAGCRLDAARRRRSLGDEPADACVDGERCERPVGCPRELVLGRFANRVTDEGDVRSERIARDHTHRETRRRKAVIAAEIPCVHPGRAAVRSGQHDVVEPDAVVLPVLTRGGFGHRSGRDRTESVPHCQIIGVENPGPPVVGIA